MSIVSREKNPRAFRDAQDCGYSSYLPPLTEARATIEPELTRRERQTAELIKSGLSDKEIARRLNISLGTTKSHVHNLLVKLNARRRTEVADHLRR